MANIAAAVAFVSICIDDRLRRCFLFHESTVIPCDCQNKVLVKGRFDYKMIGRMERDVLHARQGELFLSPVMKTCADLISIKHF